MMAIRAIIEFMDPSPTHYTKQPQWLLYYRWWSNNSVIGYYLYRLSWSRSVFTSDGTGVLFSFSFTCRFGSGFP